MQSDITYNTAAESPIADGRISGCLYKVNNTLKVNTSYRYNDSYKRLTAKLNIMGDYTYDREFTYNKTRISRVLDEKNGLAYHDVSYGYDSLGRITSEADSIDLTYNNTYVYDSLGQLVRENNKSLDKTFIYSYNGNGDITEVESYPYTTGEVGVNPSTVSYTYDGDKLTRYKYNNISYNSIGYPIKCGDRTFVWTDGKLTRMCDDIEDLSDSSAEDICFGYNGYGQRISKTYSYDPGDDYSGDFTIGKNTSYTYDESGRLIREQSIEYFSESASVTRELIYLYDESGVIGVAYSRDGGSYTPYYYRKNAFGDVIAIYDATGNRKAEYAYDACGNCKLVYEATGSEIGWINPIRYRGYYYDEDTGLYYLNARYYNPEWRRFISPDSTEFIYPETPNGLNLYAYCYNDPVNFVDPSGNLGFWISALIGAGILGLAGIGATAYSDYIDDGEIFNGSSSAEAYIGNTLVATSIGALCGGLIFTFGPTITSFLGSSFSFALPSLGALSTGGALALAGGVTVTVTGAQIVGGAVVATGIGILFFSHPNTGPIRFSDGTGIDPSTGKPVTDKDRAYEIYRSLKNIKQKLNWKKWIKGKGWRTNHLK